MGDTLTFENYSVHIVEMDGLRIDRLKVIPTPKAPDEGDDNGSSEATNPSAERGKTSNLQKGKTITA